MENASKALLIAAGVLIAILILTLFSYLMRQMGSSTSGIYSKLSQREITEFNQKFLNYEGRGIYSVGKDNEGNDLYNPLTVQDVATLINLARDSKENHKYLNEVKIIYQTENLADTENYIHWLETNKNSHQQYNCREVKIDTSTLLVNEVIIENHN